LLLLLGERETLSFLPAFRAFLSVVSAFTVSHKPQPSPACFTIATDRASGSREFSEFGVWNQKAVSFSSAEIFKRVVNLDRVISDEAVGQALDALGFAKKCFHVGQPALSANERTESVRELTFDRFLTASNGRTKEGLKVFDNADRGSGRHGRWAGLRTWEECLAPIGGLNGGLKKLV
jgi:hypothetical protein